MKDLQLPERRRKPLIIKEFPWLLLSIQAVLVVAGLLILFGYALSYKPKKPAQEETSTLPITTESYRYHKHRPFEANSIKDTDESSESEILEFTKAAIYTDNAECTAIARSILLRGGNVVDAAAAASICLAAVHPHRGGLGGGLMATLQTSEGCSTVNARETAPALLSLEAFVKKPDEMAVGPKAVGTPGFIAGLARLLSEFGSGSLSWQQLAEPTIDLCRNGFLVDKILAKALQDYRAMIMNNSIMRKNFINQLTNDVWIEEDRISCSNFGETLAELVEYEDVVDYFYRGPFAESVVEQLHREGGRMTHSDMEDYECEVSKGRSVTVDKVRSLCGHGPPSSFTAIQLAARVAQYSNSSLDIVLPLTLKERRRIGDPMYSSQHRAEQLFHWEIVKHFVTKVENGERISSISDDSVVSSDVLIMDGEGNAIALSSSLGDHFGSRIFSNLGFFLNNAIASFDPPQPSKLTSSESDINMLQPGKSPRSPLSPVIGYENGEVSFVLSGSQPSSEVATLARLLNGSSYTQQGNRKEAPTLLRQGILMHAQFVESHCSKCVSGLQ